jgi:hypothetical protein
MKKLDVKKQLIPLVIFAIVVIVLLIVIPWGSAAALARKLFIRLVASFEHSWRFKIAYISAVVLLAGLLLLFIRYIASRMGKGEQQVSSLSDTNGSGGKNGKYRKVLLAAAIIIVFISWSPYPFQGQDIHVKIFDNLDSHIPHSKVLAEGGKAFSLSPDTRLDNFLNGIALSGVDSGYNVLTWLFMLFPPFAAYALNDLLMRLAALLGMILLLKRHVIKDSDNHFFVIAGAALCFSLLPFYPAGGLSIAGIPLLLYSFLNILEGKWKPSDFIIIFVFPFYSKLALAGLFIAVALTVVFVVDWVRQKKINLAYLGGLALLTVTYMFTQFHLVYSFLAPDFTSFREEISMLAVPAGTAFKNTIHNFLFDRVNVTGAQNVFVIAAAALAVGIVIVKKIKVKLLAASVFAVLVTSFMWGFKYWAGIMPLREKFQLVNAFDFSRFYWFNPFLWYVIFALSLLVIARTIKFGKVVASAFIVFQVLFMLVGYNWGFRYPLGFRTSIAGSALTYSLSYREFYSQDLFAEIDRYINKPKADYRVISLGIHPGISQYNGFYTLDIYTDVYSLEYKHKFRRIIEKELAKSDVIKLGFDTNAKRCFILVSELHANPVTRGMAFSRGITKHEKNLKIKHLDLNTAALKEMGGEYIFSAVEILNHAENNLSFERVFENSTSPWRIYLYKVI